MQKCGGHHVATATHQGAHAAAGAGKRQGEHHEFCRIGMGLDIGRPHQGQHGHDAHGTGSGIMHERRCQAQTDGDNKGESGNAVTGLFNNKISQAPGQSGLFQGNGKNQAAHDKNHHRMHIRRPRIFDIPDIHDDEKNTDTDGRDLEGNGLGHKEKNKHGQEGQKTLCFRRETVYIIDLKVLQFQVFSRFPQVYSPEI